VLEATAPDVWDAVVRAGGVPVQPPGAPAGVVALQSRRSTFEAALRGVAALEPRLMIRRGHAERVLSTAGRASGVRVDGRTVEAELVIDAGGRSGRVGDRLRPPAEGGPCGFAYVSRMYRQRAGTTDLDGTTVPMAQSYQGYLAIVFPQDAGTLSTLIVRRADDHELSALRYADRFDAAARAIPHLSRWTDDERFEPLGAVMPGGGLSNTYRKQADLPGLLSVGDAVCTTNPAAGRGISLGLAQAAALLGLLEEGDIDIAGRFQAWCDERIRPWFDDHVHWDATLLRRFRGEDIDVESRIPSDVICAAAQIDATIAPAAQQYLAMAALPRVLDVAEERARAALRTGWRPPVGDGPTRDELADTIASVSAAA
jgi:flavin-dependent dehydrogenase